MASFNGLAIVGGSSFGDEDEEEEELFKHEATCHM
jgi:hypothetical protein